MKTLQRICLCGMATGMLLFLPFHQIYADSPALKSSPAANTNSATPASQPIPPAHAAAPLQEEMQYRTASQLAEEENLMAILWVQRSAEFRGLCYQAYNLAAMETEKAIAQRNKKENALRKAEKKQNDTAQSDSMKASGPERNMTEKIPEKKKIQQEPLLPLAVVLDIDDTIVCHALLQAYYTEHPEAKADYNAWEQWIAQHKTLLPGAREFLQYADQHGVQIFYVTGRGPKDRSVTSRFLQKAGLPFTDETHLLMNDRSGSKMNHFAKLARRYDIICYLGDNAGDFPISAIREENSIIYKKKADDNRTDSKTRASENRTEPGNAIRTDCSAANQSETETGKRKTEMPLDIPAMLKHDKNPVRNKTVDIHRESFGTKFILLPNPMYGDWEYNLAQNYRRLPAEQRIALRKAALKCFTYIPHTEP